MGVSVQRRFCCEVRFLVRHFSTLPHGAESIFVSLSHADLPRARLFLDPFPLRGRGFALVGVPLLLCHVAEIAAASRWGSVAYVDGSETAVCNAQPIRESGADESSERRVGAVGDEFELSPRHFTELCVGGVCWEFDGSDEGVLRSLIDDLLPHFN